MSVDTTKYPNLTQEGYRYTSPKTTIYNCIAHAAGDDGNWWWPSNLRGSYWPMGAPKSPTVKACVAAFRTIGYAICDSPEFEDGTEKIAIYSARRKLTHAARQLPNGLWTHKLGKNVDIETTLKGVEDSHYGKVSKIMSRPIP